LKYGSVIFE